MDIAALFDWSLALAGAVAIVGAALRGFTGFGANLIWGPALLWLYGPVEMVAIMAITSIATSVQICIPAAREADWRQIGWIIAASLLATPLGVYSLLHAEPDLVKRAIGGFILVCAAVLATGWRYRGRRGPLAHTADGALAGWVAGFAGVGGPVVVLYLMAAPGDIRVQRANNVIAVSLLAPATVASLAVSGAITGEAAVRALIMIAPYMLGLAVGQRLFRIAPVHLFRRITIGLLIAIGLAALLG